MKKILGQWADHDSYFRAGAGVVVLNENNHVLMFERADFPGDYQFSQGGLDAGEEPTIGAFRELYEETGISPEQITVLGELPYWVSYAASVTRNKTFEYRGQTQRWFYARLNPDITINVSQAQDKEFLSHTWMSIDEALEHIVDFKKDMYIQILDYLQESIL